MAITPVPGLTSVIAAGNTPVAVVDVLPQGGFITNPLSAADQGIAVAESLYIDPTGSSPTLSASGTTFELRPGQTWTIIPGQNTQTIANATSAGHKFSAVAWY